MAPKTAGRRARESDAASGAAAAQKAKAAKTNDMSGPNPSVIETLLLPGANTQEPAAAAAAAPSAPAAPGAPGAEATKEAPCLLAAPAATGATETKQAAAAEEAKQAQQPPKKEHVKEEAAKKATGTVEAGVKAKNAAAGAIPISFTALLEIADLSARLRMAKLG